MEQRLSQVRYKTFANRTSQDIKFDQILRTKPLTTHTSPTNTNTFSTPLVSKPIYSPRKRVNVVSFTPGTDGQELITKSPEKVTAGANDLPSDPVASFQTKHASEGSPTSKAFDVPVLAVTTGGIQAHIITGTTSTSCFNVLYTSQTPNPVTVMGKRSTDTSSRQGGAKGQAGVILQAPETAPAGKPVPPNQRIKSVNKSQPPVPVTRVPSLAREPIIARKPPSVRPELQLPNSRPAPSLNPSASANPTNPTFKVIPPSRAASFPPQSFRAVSELPATKLQPSSVHNGKRKRVAYNPRPWQQELDPEDGSPTKQPKLPNSRTNPGLLTINPTLTAVHSLSSASRPDSATQPTAVPNKTSPGSNTSKPVVIPKPVMATNRPRNFDFSDSEGDEAGKPPLAISRTKLPRLTSLMGGLSHSPPSPASVKEPSPHPSDKDQEEPDEADENGSGELDDEVEDVKPWFCPASRREPQRTTTKPTTQVSCPAGSRVEKSQKPLYTVVRKVSEAHVCQERGETQHLLDDVEYLIDGLADHNQANTRALSVLTLANKCLTASFRYLISAHGLVKRICANLHDAYKDYTLALTGAGLFFILSRDRDPNIFDAESLPVVIKLLQAPDSLTVDNAGGAQAVARANKEADRVRTRVRQLLEGLQQQQQQHSRNSSNNAAAETGSASSQPTTVSPKRPILSTALSAPASLAPAHLTAGTAGLNTRHLQMTRQLTAADLVLESILNLGTRKAADWFKAELRQGGGLDCVADAASDAVDYLADLDPTERGRHRSKSVWRSSANPTGLDGFALDKLRRVCHYTKLLENMTYMNTDNQTYLVRYRDRLLVNRFIRCIRVCASHLPKQTAPPQRSTAQVSDLGKGRPDKPPADQMILVDCLLGIFRFLVNVSHNEFASDRLGGCPGLLETILECVLNLPPRLPTNKRFDLLVLTLCLLANLCEHCPENRTRLVHLDIPKPPVEQDEESGLSDEEDDADNEDSSSRDRIPMASALDEIVHLFLVREEQARNHDFERDDEDAAAAEARRREQPPWNASSDIGQLDPLGQPTHVEEAGLKWRLIEDRKAAGMLSGGRLP
ncbi:hypothetical protein CRM22_001913, partial [Opisthorchis felineus]